MATALTVLLSSAGRRGELIHCFRNDARELGLKLTLLAADMNPEMSPACHLADRAFPVERCTHPRYISQLLEICGKERVQLLVPTIDTELEPLANHREQFQQTGVTLAISSPEVVALARHKKRTAEFFQQCGIPTPKTGSPGELFQAPHEWHWPVLAKPVAGSASAGIKVFHTWADVPPSLEHLENYVIQEFWPGKEYTVNLFFDRESQLRAAVPHRRWEVRAGEVSKGTTEREESLLRYARQMAARLAGAFGALCFQGMITPAGNTILFELNARFGGGYPLAHQAGVRFPRWLMETALGMPVSARDEWHAGITMLRYDQSVFLTDKGGGLPV